VLLVLGLAVPVSATAVVVARQRSERVDVARDPAADLTTRSPSPDTSPTTEPAARPPRMRVVGSSTIRKAPPPPEPTETEAPEPVRERARPEEPEPAAPISFRIGTFNVFGSQHTGPGGVKPGWPDAPQRTAGTAELIGRHGVDVLGTQELQSDQLRDLQGRTGMAAYPGLGWGEAETDNSILWDPGVFELVSASRYTITFMGRPRPQPIVRLRHLATGRELYVVNTHPSAGDGQYAAERANGHQALVGVVNDLRADGTPVLVTGDMNDREAFYCRVVPAASLTASNGGSYAGGCQPPPGPLPVDWVVGSGATWSGYWRDTTPVERRISNHFFVSAEATIG